MNILKYTCSSPLYNIILYPIKNIMNILMIISPILLIISFLIIFIIGLMNPDDKKLISKLKNAIIALICVFFVSLFVNITMKVLGSSTDITECWNNAQKTTQTKNYYDINKEVDKKEAKKVNE